MAKVSKTQEAETLVIIIARTTIEYDGTRYAAGENLSVRPDDLQQLLDVGAATVPTEDTKAVEGE